MNNYRLAHAFIMFMGNTAVFFAILYMALAARNLTQPDYYVYMQHVQAFILLFVMYEIILYIAGFWGRHIIPTAKNIFELLLPAHVLASAIMLLYFYILSDAGLTPKTSLLIFSSMLFVGMYTWKLIGLRLFTLYPIKAILIGQELDLQEIFHDQPLWNVRLVEKFSYQVGLAEITKALEQTGADTIFVSTERYPRIDILYKLMFANIAIIDTVDLREEIHSKIDLDQIDQNWFLTHINRQSSTYRFLKRFMDVCAGGVLLAICIVIVPFLFIAIKIDDGGKLLIKQKRVGLRGNEFNFYKFRSMSTDNDQWQNKTQNVTRVGAFIRKTRIDELAQCWNIIKGDISLVGPRAILTSEYQTMVKRNPFQQARLLAQPGLTGWAQVQQKHAPENESEAAERLAYDLYYIKNISLWLDIKIILQTIKKVLERAGMR